jgi:hypothetical protein
MVLRAVAFLLSTSFMSMSRPVSIKTVSEYRTQHQPGMKEEFHE